MAESKDTDTKSLDEYKEEICQLNSKIAALRSSAVKAREKLNKQLEEERLQHEITKEFLEKKLELHEKKLKRTGDEAEIQSLQQRISGLLTQLKEYERKLKISQQDEKNTPSVSTQTDDSDENEVQKLKQQLNSMADELEGLKRIEEKLGKVEHALETSQTENGRILKTLGRVEHALEKSETKNEEMETKFDLIIAMLKSQEKVSSCDPNEKSDSKDTDNRLKFSSDEDPLPPIQKEGSYKYNYNKL